MPSLPAAAGGSGRSQRHHLARLGRGRIVIAVLTAVVVIVGAGAAGTVLAAAHRYDDNVTRVEAFSDSDAQQLRPRHPVDAPLTFLVVGSDSRAQDSSDPSEVAATGGQRTDTIMLVHLQRDQKHGYVVSIPRDTFVDIPRGQGWDGGKAKINAAFEYGGIPLLVKTVQNFTHARIDHVVVIDFKGVERVVDAVGGIDVTVTQPVSDSHIRTRFAAGVNHLDGEQALDYVRQRYGLPEGDFDRIRRQHQFLFALLSKAGSADTLTNPGKLNAFLDAASKSITVDNGLEIVDLALQLRSLRPEDFTFVTTPIAGYDNHPTWGSILVPRADKAAELFASLSGDTMQSWVLANPSFVSDPTRGR